MLHVLLSLMVPVANPRTIIAEDWLPTFPLNPIIKGIKLSDNAIGNKLELNFVEYELIISEAITPPKIAMINHGIRYNIVFGILIDRGLCLV